ncbi:MAG: hypothetical protein MAG581_00619 [Deltaproteobacteria bacterium]|nr:hypothetical protein [Deltaproteobacteria bacterium]
MQKREYKTVPVSALKTHKLMEKKYEKLERTIIC